MTPPTLRIVTPDEPARKPEIVATHTMLQPAARHAFTALKADADRLGRIFAGPSASITAAAEIERLCAEIVANAGRVKRWAR